MKFLSFLWFEATLLFVTVLSMDEFLNNNHLFTTSVYKEIMKQERGNLLASAVSVEIVLAILLLGAKNKTESEIRTSLHLPNTFDQVQSVLKMIFSILKNDQYYTLHAANRIYIDKKISIKEQFKKLTVDVFKSNVENADFDKNIETANSINRWIEEQTANKIHNLINPSDLTPETTMILVNALYFKGKWTQEFDKKSTKKSSFYKTPTDVLQVDTMYQNGKKFGYYEDSKLNTKFLELPFKSNDVTFIIALPNKIEELAKLESQIEKVLSSVSFSKETVNVALPKFKIESRIDFNQIIKTLGVHEAFSRTEADFSGIAGKKGDLSIGKIVQKTFIDIDEEGVEAAAATVIATPRMWRLDSPRPKEFIADHPFIFYIKVKSLILFCGRVVTPNH